MLVRCSGNPVCATVCMGHCQVGQQLSVDAGFIARRGQSRLSLFFRQSWTRSQTNPSLGGGRKPPDNSTSTDLIDPDKAMLRSQHGRWPPPFSPHSRPAGSRRLNPSHSVSCCADASASQSPSPFARADVAANLTFLASIVFRSGSFGQEGVLF